jgi:hypothetical protein
VPADVAASVAYLEAIATLVAGGSVAGVPAPIFAWAPWLTPVLHPRAVFSRPSIASYRGRSGYFRYAAANVPVFECDPLAGVCKGLIVEKAATQDLQFSEQIDNIKWTKSLCSIAPNTITYPDGSTGDKIVEDTTASNSHAIIQHRTVVAGTQQCAYTVVSAGERNRVTLHVYGSGNGYYVNFNFETKSCVLTKTGPLSSNPFYGAVELLDGRFLVWLSCVCSGSATDVVSQLSLANSIGNTLYTGDGTSGVYIQSFGSCSGFYPPSYLPTGWETTSTTSNNIGTGAKTFTVGYDSTVPGRAIPAGAAFRAWQKSNAANYMTGTVTSHTGTSLMLNATATGGSGAAITDWMIQAGASVTRAADICTVPLASLLGSAGEVQWTGKEGALVVQALTAPGLPAESGVQVLVQLDDGTANNRIRIVRNAAGEIRCVVDVGGVNQVDLSVGTVPNSTEFKVAFAFAAGSFAHSLNGISLGTSAAGAMPTGMTTLRLGSDAAGGSQWDGPIKLCSLYNRIPSSDKLTALANLEVPSVPV